MAKGLSLLETVIYVAILAVLLVVVLNGTLIVSGAFGEARIDRLILLQGEGTMERMLREVRLAHSVDKAASTLGSHPGRLFLNTIVGAGDDTVTTREFYISSSTLMLREGGVNEIALTTGVQITNLLFYAIDASSSEAVHIEMTVETGEGTFEESHNFYGTAVLRRSY